LAELHQRKVTTTGSGHTTSNWYAHRAGLPSGIARQRLAVANTLRDALPEVADALVEGRIGYDHARVIAEATNDRNADAMAAMSGWCCDPAQRPVFNRWRREVQDLAHALDPDGPHNPAGDVARNRLTLSRTDVFLLVNGELTGEDALIAEHAIEAKTDELYLRYSRDRDHHRTDIPSRPQLRAEALTELLRFGHSAPTGTRAPKPEVTLTLHHTPTSGAGGDEVPRPGAFSWV